MNYKEIPRTDLRASVICLGTSHIGSAIGDAESNDLLDTYIEMGGSFIDTAEVYANWLPIEPSSSERFLGQWIKSRGSRNRIVLATKGGHPLLDKPERRRITEEDIRTDLEGSLRRLQTDYIDIYYLHRDDPRIPVETIVDLLEAHVRKGNIRYYGCSNWTLERIKQANQYASSRGYTGFVAVQNLWNLGQVNEGSLSDPTMVVSDSEFVQWHEQEQIAAIPYSSQANGYFSGKYRSLDAGALPEGSGAARVYHNAASIQRMERAERLAREHNATSTQIALAYLLAHPFPVFPIIGCKNKEHLADSMLAADVALDYKEAAALIE